jgi:hypothetical protein
MMFCQEQGEPALPYSEFRRELHDVFKKVTDVAGVPQNEGEFYVALRKVLGQSPLGDKAMTITPEQVRALLQLYETVKFCDEIYDWDQENPPAYLGPSSAALLMWQAMDVAYKTFGYEPSTSRPILTTEYIREMIDLEAKEAETTL